MPYAQADPSVGIVQSPQYFEVRDDKNWLENGAGSVQEFFYRWVMPARDVRHSPICVGTNALYRRSALEATDGGALVENSEDVHTGFDLMCKGYATKYIPVILAKGLCPHTLQTFFNQQHRWCWNRAPTPRPRRRSPQPAPARPQGPARRARRPHPVAPAAASSAIDRGSCRGRSGLRISGQCRSPPAGGLPRA